MENNLQKRDNRRARRKHQVRKGVRGTAEKPRLSVFRSNQHLTAQLIDDENRVTLSYYGTMTKELKAKKLGKKSKEAAKLIGTLTGKKAQELNIERVVFDRGFYKYHGLIAAVADAAREVGLKF